MENCIFCKLVAKEVPSNVVYEDENFLAFLDASPQEIGHTLVVPRQHYKDIFDIPNEILRDLMVLVKKISLGVSKAVDTEHINILQNNGSKAGQTVFHFHMHIIPREGKIDKDENIAELIRKEI